MFRVVVLAACLAAGAARAQELTGSLGLLRSDEPRRHSYGWLLSYSQDLGPQFAASLSYQNEGHVPRHHRDGYAAQLWWRTTVLSPQLGLAAGIGPYRYFDTARTEDDAGFEDQHGWGLVYSLAATWRPTSSRWLYQLRADRVLISNSIDTTRVTAGIGYRLERDDSVRAQVPDSKRNELTLFTGKTIVNSFESETATARSVELRHAFGPLWRGTLAWLDESDAQLLRRRGVLAQAWLEPSFEGERLTLGIGYGPYIAADDLRRDRNGLFGSGVVTLTASLRFRDDWRVRFSWNRVVSRYDRDTDVTLFGLSYRL
jgi:hypothetical protein